MRRMLRKKTRRARDKQRLPLESRTTGADEIIREFGDACQKLLADAFRKLAAKTAVGGKPAAGAAKEYRNVPGFRGYRVNAKERVQSCWATDGTYVSEEWHTLRPYEAEGRRFVRLSKRGERYDRQVGELVLRAWVSKPPAGKRFVRHLNNKLDDDRLENLEWSDRKQQRVRRLPLTGSRRR